MISRFFDLFLIFLTLLIFCSHFNVTTVSAKNINFERALTTATDMRVTSSALAKKKARSAILLFVSVPYGVLPPYHLYSLRHPFFPCYPRLIHPHHPHYPPLHHSYSPSSQGVPGQHPRHPYHGRGQQYLPVHRGNSVPISHLCEGPGPSHRLRVSLDGAAC